MPIPDLEKFPKEARDALHVLASGDRAAGVPPYTYGTRRGWAAVADRLSMTTEGFGRYLWHRESGYIPPAGKEPATTPPRMTRLRIYALMLAKAPLLAVLAAGGSPTARREVEYVRECMELNQFLDAYDDHPAEGGGGRAALLAEAA